MSIGKFSFKNWIMTMQCNWEFQPLFLFFNFFLVIYYLFWFSLDFIMYINMPGIKLIHIFTCMNLRVNLSKINMSNWFGMFLVKKKSQLGIKRRHLVLVILRNKTQTLIHHSCWFPSCGHFTVFQFKSNFAKFPLGKVHKSRQKVSFLSWWQKLKDDPWLNARQIKRSQGKTCTFMWH